MRRMLSCGDRIEIAHEKTPSIGLWNESMLPPPEIAPVVRREGVMTNDFLRIGRRI